MLDFLSNLRPSKYQSDFLHPNTPVLPEKPIKVNKIETFRREFFPSSGPIPWLDREDAPLMVEQLEKEGKLSKLDAQLCWKWIVDGYIILEKLFDPVSLDKAWMDYENAIATGVIEPEPNCPVNGLPGRNLNTHFSVKKMDQLLRHEAITRIISLLMGAKCLPFQTITGHNGSEQLEHSDAIHMTTYPMDYLAATWTAFEDINPDSGPLVYYPGSHRIPHFLSKEANISIDEFQERGYFPYHEKYEPGLQKIIEDNQLQAKYFYANKGDVLVWHSNLIHGGSKRKNLNLSRKALVCHYFAEGCICYHDLAASLSHLHH